MGRKRHLSEVVRETIVGLAGVAAWLWLSTSHAQNGQVAYEKICSTCHAKGVGGAPRADDASAWQARLARNGYSALFDSAIKGKGAMPPKGGSAALSEDDVMSAVMHILRLSAAGAAVAANAPVAKTAVTVNAASGKGKSVYQSSCSACHATGAAGSPKIGDAMAWGSRIGGGIAALHNSAIKGKGAMPPKGGNASLADADVKAAVDYMVAQSRVAASNAAVKPNVAKVVLAGADGGSGKSVYQATCAACHALGIAGAPKFGDREAWALRTKTGTAALYANAIKGKGAMPAKGGNATLADAEIKSAVDFMLAQIDVIASSKIPAAAKLVDNSIVAPSASPVSESKSTPNLTVAPAPSETGLAGVNSFNRLLQAPGKRNLPPLEDGIHDATNEATALLQAPLHAFAELSKSNAGNRIDWVKALNDKKLSPRADKQDQKAEMAVLDLNIVREVKGSMPDVVYPHRQHTQWLDCSNCHPAIFIPQKGANQMSMASIILGQKCGVCHGKVAFPVSECRLCHSKNKDAATASGSTRP